MKVGPARVAMSKIWQMKWNEGIEKWRYLLEDDVWNVMICA